MRKSTITLAALLAACWLLAAAPARAGSFVEVAMFDRLRSDCDGVDLALAAQRGWDCRYDYRTTLHLEFEALPELTWLRVLARTQVTARQSEDTFGHFNPVRADLGGGLVMAWGAWSLTALASSRHCVDFRCAGDTYNALILRWSGK